MGAPDKIKLLLGQLDLEEKCLLLAGKNMWETHNIDRLGIGSLKMTDGPAGVRGSTWTDGTHTTLVPCGISLAATFDPGLVERVGDILGGEARSKNAHLLLAPTMNMSRSPLGGRNFENFGEDPYLTGIMAARYIKGVQARGVGACMKHFVANDMETRRFNMDQQIDERTLREIYIKPFDMVNRRSPAWTAMSAYPKINGEHVDCSTFLLHDVLRRDLGFEGVVVSDWGGTNDTVKSITAGTDVEMPGPAVRYGSALIEAVRSGAVSETDHIDVSVARILQLLDRAGLLDGRQGHEDREERDSDLPESRLTARDAASGGIVLLKNNGVLPLDPSKMGKLAIIGPNAKHPTVGGTGSAAANPYYIATPYESIASAVREADPASSVSFAQGIRTNLQPALPGPMLRTPDGSKVGMRVDFYAGHEFEGPIISSSHWQSSLVFLMGGGDTPEILKDKPHCYRMSGTLTPAETGTYDFSLSNTGKARLYVDDTLLVDNTDWTKTGGSFMNCGSANRLAEMHLEEGRSYSLRIDNVVALPPIPAHDNTLFHTTSGVRAGIQIRIDEQALFDEAVKAAREADEVILIVGHNNDTEKEGVDRISLTLPRRTDELVAAVCEVNPKTVVITQSACAIAMPWADEAPAILHAWYQGQENGNAIADVVFGKTSPSGKLPITFPGKLEDHGSDRWFPGDVENDVAEFGEGILVGYRWFDAKAIEPLWPFGFGMSYTSFSISDVKVRGRITRTSTAVLTAAVANTGPRDGAEVLQAYITSSPAIREKGRNSAVRALAGFAKVHVASGQSEVVEISIERDSVAWFDVEGKGGPGSGGAWRVDGGIYTCYIGTSSRHLVAEVEVQVE